MLNGFCKKITIKNNSYWISLQNITDTHVDFMICNEELTKILWSIASLPSGDWDLTTAAGLEKVALEIFDFWYSSIQNNAQIHKQAILKNRKEL